VVRQVGDRARRVQLGLGSGCGRRRSCDRRPVGQTTPVTSASGGARLVGMLLWEGVVYGFGEAILLAMLPVLAVW
jgi:hypothetical protein